MFIRTLFGRSPRLAGLVTGLLVAAVAYPSTAWGRTPGETSSARSSARDEYSVDGRSTRFSESIVDLTGIGGVRAPALSNPPSGGTDEPVLVTVIATTAAVAAIAGASYGIYRWAHDNFTRAVVGQVCHPPDGHPDNAWSTEDQGIDYAQSDIHLFDVADDPCGSAYALSYADDVWGDEDGNDAYIKGYAQPHPSSNQQADNHVDFAGSAMADDFKVVTQELPFSPSETDTVLLVHTVAIDSFHVATAFPPVPGDSIGARWRSEFFHDGESAYLFSADFLWTAESGLTAAGDLSLEDFDIGYDPEQGWVVELSQFVHHDTTTYVVDAGTAFREVVPESVDVHTEVHARGAATASGPGEPLSGHDGGFEDAYCWSPEGVVPPDYGIFAESFDSGGPTYLLGASFWLTQAGDYGGEPVDVYIYDGGVTSEPGAVLDVLPSVVFPFVPEWPEVGHNRLNYFSEVDGEFTIGLWSGYAPDLCPVYVGADRDGLTGGGHPWTKVAPGLGFPEGWQHPEVVFGPTAALGIGAWLEIDTYQDIGGPAERHVDRPRLGEIANPIRAKAAVRFHVPRARELSLGVFDVSGRPVQTLADGWQAAGTHSLTWDGRDARGRQVPGGVYYLRLSAGDTSESRPLIVIR